jgi:C1A family cysteine protease
MATGPRIYNCKITHLPPHMLKIKVIPPVPTQPATVDLRSKMPPVYDQGQLGSCTANALCAAFEYDDPGFMGSRLFLYYNERMLEGTIPEDVGAMLSDGVKCMQKYGLCLEKEWPYNISKFTMKPLGKCYVDASIHKAVTASNIAFNLTAMKNALASGFPFVAGIAVYASFESLTVAQTGIVPMPKAGEALLGGHAVLVVGYNDADQQFIVRNSWGAGWGDKGYFYLPYAYMTNPHMVTELWNITKVQP